MALQASYDNKDDIPDGYAELFSERGGKWECTGIVGMKTQADVDRVTTSLGKEREEHKATKVKLGAWDGLDHDEVQGKLDRIPELEAAAKGKLDEAQIDEIVERRVGGVIASKLAPVERENRKLKKENGELSESNTKFAAADSTRRLHDSIRPEMTEAHVLGAHHEDVLMYADRHFERTEDGHLQTRDGVGVTPGLAPKEWLEEMLGKRPGWLAPDAGGGARGSDRRGGLGGNNPWSAEHWNMTEQGQYYVKHGAEKAAAAAKAAGTTVGGRKPAAGKA